MKKVWIEPGCTTCGLCEFIAEDIFTITETAQVKEQAPLQKHKDLIKEAAQNCPVSVIKYEE